LCNGLQCRPRLDACARTCLPTCAPASHLLPCGGGHVRRSSIRLMQARGPLRLLGIISSTELWPSHRATDTDGHARRVACSSRRFQCAQSVVMLSEQVYSDGRLSVHEDSCIFYSVRPHRMQSTSSHGATSSTMQVIQHGTRVPILHRAASQRGVVAIGRSNRPGRAYDPSKASDM